MSFAQFERKNTFFCGGEGGGNPDLPHLLAPSKMTSLVDRCFYSSLLLPNSRIPLHPPTPISSIPPRSLHQSSQIWVYVRQRGTLKNVKLSLYNVFLLKSIFFNKFITSWIFFCNLQQSKKKYKSWWNYCAFHFLFFFNFAIFSIYNYLLGGLSR